MLRRAEQPQVTSVVFDLGNVLALHDDEKLFAELARRTGRSPTEVATRFDAGLWDDLNRGRFRGDDIRRAVCRALGVELGADDFFEWWNCHFTVNDALVTMLHGLVGKAKLLLLSNTNDLHIRFLRPRLPVLERFDCLLLSHELGTAKPDEAIYRLALKASGSAPEKTAYFDDSPQYVAAANALGIRGQRFTDNSQFIEQLRGLGL